MTIKKEQFYKNVYVFLFIHFDFGEVLLLEDRILDRGVKSNLFLNMEDFTGNKSSIFHKL